MLRRIGLPVLLAVSLLTVAPPRPTSAGAENDIPGMPATGTVTGELSGTVYDLVYYVDVPKGYVLVLNLLGPINADFDLYLWPSTATTVYAQTGYLARSNKPGTSVETITWPSTADQRVYIDVTRYGSAGGTFTLSVDFSADATPPVARLMLNGGVSVAASSTVDVLAGGYDSLSGVAEAALSDDGVTWSPWQPAPLQTTWTFSGSDGVKVLWAKAKNGVGLVSAPVKASVRIDTTLPAVAQVSPPRDSIVTVERPAVAVTFSEPIDPASWQDSGLTLLGPDGVAVPGSLVWTAPTYTGTFTPSAPLVVGSTYVVSLGPIRDLAGNSMDPVASWSLKRLAAGRVTVSVPTKTITYGASLSFTGSRSPLGSTTVTLRHRPAGSTAWQSLIDGSIDSATYQLTTQPPSTGRYRVEMGATETSGPAASATLSIVVKRAVRLDGTGASVVRTAKAGRSVAVTARISPVAPNVPVTLRLYKRVGTRWVLSTSRSLRTGADGSVTSAWKPRAGRWAWRVTVSGTTLLASNTTAYYQWRVSR